MHRSDLATYYIMATSFKLNTFAYRYQARALRTLWVDSWLPALCPLILIQMSSYSDFVSPFAVHFNLNYHYSYLFVSLNLYNKLPSLIFTQTSSLSVI